MMPVKDFPDTLICIFSQVGYIINQLVPELYDHQLFLDDQIIAIDCPRIKDFSSYKNLKKITLSNIDNKGSLISIASCKQLTELHMNNFTGSIDSLVSCKKLTELRMNSFTGSIDPLASCKKLTKLHMNNFTGSIDPLASCKQLTVYWNCSSNTL